jgi:hypothetical protein
VNITLDSGTHTSACLLILEAIMRIATTVALVTGAAGAMAQVNPASLLNSVSALCVSPPFSGLEHLTDAVSV